MEFKYANLPENPTREQIKDEINRLKKMKITSRNADKNLKVLANSSYGVMGFHKFVDYNVQVAESVSQQGKIS